MASDKSPALPVKNAGGRRLQNRDRLEADILEQAVRVFAENGYEGASIATIAERAGLSKQNLMYYFPSKQLLYQRVLDDVLDDWLARMESLANEHDEPRDVLRAYIGAKLRFSREQPWASRVYALEVINGAPQGVVALGGDEPVCAVAGDQGLVEQALQHLGAGTALNVVREPFDLAAGVFYGVGEDGVLGMAQLYGGHLMLLLGG